MRTANGFVKTAHDPGDPQLCSHCPFCGSGQITGRSDGGIDCAFCGMNFLVRVQPAFPGMPQVPGMGMPTDIGPDMPPGMPPGGAPPPGEEDGSPFGGGDEDEEAEDTSDAPPGSDGDAGPPGGSKKPPPGKKAVRRYRTISGDVLDERRYIRHLAVMFSGNDPQVLATLRREAAARDRQSATITVTGPPDQLSSFASLCKTIENLCAVGASRTIKYSVDGDGSASLRFGLGALEHAEGAEAEDDEYVHVPGLGG